jgi:hypothetical protein
MKSLVKERSRLSQYCLAFKLRPVGAVGFRGVFDMLPIIALTFLSPLPMGLGKGHRPAFAVAARIPSWPFEGNPG